MRANLWALGALSLAACATATDSAPDVVYAGPELSHEPPASPLEGTPVTLSVTATDADGVAQVQLFYRTKGSPTWASVAMTAEGETYTAEVPAAGVLSPALEYYFKAADLADPSATSYLPEASTSAPFSLAVGVVGRSFPFTETFEPPDPELATITTIDWHNASLGFRGYGWDLAGNTAHGGSYSAYHGVISEGATPAPDDWLVSPAIDLTTAPTAQVTWYETSASPEGATHGLYISTGSSVPDDGEYVPVAEALPAVTEDEWHRSDAYDLSAYVGKVVYLAWRYQGAAADDWYIDDVSVTELQADLSDTLSVDPAELHPGETGTLSITVNNVAPVPAEGLTVSVSFPEGGASVTPEVNDLGTLAAATSTVTTFPLTIDGATPDNSYLPVRVTLTSGDVVVVDDERLLVGQQSVANVDWLSIDDGSLKLTVGVGDPESPDWSTQMVSGTVLAGANSFSADITDAWPYLAPAAGDLRWWVVAESSSGGAIQDFTLDFDGTSYASTEAPVAVDAAGSGVCYLPEPPDPVVSKTTTSPTTLTPGTTDATVSITVKNNGADTSGPLTATLVSTDVDLTVTSGGPVAVGGAVLSGGATAVLSSAFTFDVASAHIDSSPVTADLVLDDGVESWSLPVSLAVPFPVLRITGITIDDSAGNGDGILDPDEYAELEFRVTNVGDSATSGLVKGTLSVEATSTATATSGTNDEIVGSLGSGDTELVDKFTVQVTGGAVGDTVDLLLSSVDNVRSYESRQQLVLGEAPWQPMNDLGDDNGDVIEGYDFDFISGWYRVVGDELQIRLVSSTVFDGSRLFLEAWANSSASDYGLYRILAQSGKGGLQGYDFSSGTFYDLAEPVVSYPDAYTVELDVPIAPMGLTFDELSLGWGTGWCGEPEYYCDQYPDAWGYPYAGYSTYDWYTLSW